LGGNELTNEIVTKLRRREDRFLRVGIDIAALATLTFVVLTGEFPHPLPPLELGLLVAAAAATRLFGLGLPGKGFASFVLGVVLFAVLHRGWGWGVLVSPLGMLAGDIALRRLRLRTAIANAGHLTFGTAVVGFAYDRIGGLYGAAALIPANVVPFAVLAVGLPVLVNATFYAELALSESNAWVDLRLTMRWESVVYLFSAALALAWLEVVTRELPPPIVLSFGAALLALTIVAHWIARQGIRAEELGLVEQLSRAIAADVNLERNFVAIQRLTLQLMPWEQMGFTRYDAARHEFQQVVDTSPGRPPGHRFSADQGLPGEAVRHRKPVVSAALPLAGGRDDAPGSEIVIPLYQGDGLVGAWHVRHSDAAMYRDTDAEILNLLAPQLALALAVHDVLAPLLESSEQTAEYVEQLTATSEEIHASSEEVAAAAQGAETGAANASDRVTRAEEAMVELKATSQDAARAAEETSRAAQDMGRSAQAVRGATAATATNLQRIGATVAESAAEVERLRDAAEQVERFAETIGAIASQTNMLALNATIEAARAGQHGAGFAVVADEVRRLAEESAKEALQAGRTAVDTRRVLDHAAQLLEKMRREIEDVAGAAGRWIAELEGIVRAAETAAQLSNRMLEFPRRNTERTAEMQVMLSEVKAAAEASAGEAKVVAAAAAEQLKAIEDLSRSAIELAASAGRLAAATRFVKG
jgi:methyl-accepting chemotaxis protein/putative methionine-R-sulfoxide reductase with GAF domain